MGTAEVPDPAEKEWIIGAPVGDVIAHGARNRLCAGIVQRVQILHEVIGLILGLFLFNLRGEPNRGSQRNE